MNRNRPLFLCEYLLAEKDKDGLKAKQFTPIGIESRHGQSRHGTSLEEYSGKIIIKSIVFLSSSSTFTRSEPYSFSRLFAQIQ